MKKKLLIIGDSNCMPRYHKKSKINSGFDETYVNKLKKKLLNYSIEQVIWGGITTPQLTDYAISYFEKWKPDLIIIHSGVNDVKNQLLSNSFSNILYKFCSFFKVSKKTYKQNILYNNNLIKYHYTPKVDFKKFSSQIYRIKLFFKKSKIIWIGIHSNKMINKERANTFEIIHRYNNFLKKEFGKRFIGDEMFIKNKHYTKDGYHLNIKGQKILIEKILTIINKK
tara:strand:+ start:2269 stop:2943 length:675 start_codon:yes stop_codon:yes gene_type:complete